MSTQTTINHHLQAVGAKDVDAIMRDYTNQSVV